MNEYYKIIIKSTLENLVCGIMLYFTIYNILINFNKYIEIQKVCCVIIVIVMIFGIFIIADIAFEDLQDIKKCEK